MSIIGQLAKRDHHKEKDVQRSCTRSPVPAAKNEENLIEEANSRYFNCYILIDWLLIL